MIIRVMALMLPLALLVGCKTHSAQTLKSPNGDIVLNVDFDSTKGSLTYRVESMGMEIIKSSTVGINTELCDFRSGMKMNGQDERNIREEYTLPQGKVSTYSNSANELTVHLSRKGHKLDVIFRMYNDGLAYAYYIPGTGETVAIEEQSEIHLAGTNPVYWGQKHPNGGSYETRLNIINDKHKRMSNPVFVQLDDLKHFVLIGQAATSGKYIQSHFKRTGSVFKYEFPLDQKKLGPVRIKLPFLSPWRMAIISPDTPAKIIESYMVENLSPSTKEGFLNQDGSVKSWVKPGAVMWDYIAKGGDKPKEWIDWTAKMGWDYYLGDAGFAERWTRNGGTVEGLAKYAEAKGVALLGWVNTSECDTDEEALGTFKKYTEYGLKGIKVDFFSRNYLSKDPRGWADYADTQQSLKMRDRLFELGLEYKMLLELHGNTMPTGERRTYPNLMSQEGVNGMERFKKPVQNDLVLPYTRNVMGPMSYTIVFLGRHPGTYANQLAMAIVYEAGLMMYADRGSKLLEWKGREMISDMPVAWDEIRFIEGLPATHTVIARRKGDDWYVGGITATARKVDISLDFLSDDHSYEGLILSDDKPDAMNREMKTLNSNSKLALKLLERGGFAVRLRPVKK